MTYISAWWASLPSWAKGAIPLVVVLGGVALLGYALSQGLDVMVWFRWVGELVGR